MDQISTQIKITVAEARKALQASDLLIHECLPKSQSPVRESDPLNVTVDHRTADGPILFIAIKGTRFDGHSVISSLDPEKVGLVLTEADPGIGLPFPVLVVQNSRAAWACLCARATGNPEKKLRILGVTGTNGKTSTVWYIRQILKIAGVKSVSFGTLGCYIGENHFLSSHTTPDPPLFFTLLAQAVANDCAVLEMETSSHALAQKRLGNELLYDGSVFTSFSRDHLDFHHTMEKYFDAKMILFSKLSRDPCSHVIHSSIATAYLEHHPQPAKRTYYTYKDAEFSANDITDSEACIQPVGGQSGVFRVTGKGFQDEGSLPIVGRFALENFLAALILARDVLGVTLAGREWSRIETVPGRLEVVRSRTQPLKGPAVVVDYAHTPDALDKALRCVRDHYKGRKLWVIFGCGGDRDRGKRPEMGRIAAEIADRLIITSDNPRTEQPEVITQEIFSGVPSHLVRLASVEVNREAAIESTIRAAGAEDVILIAGKGHEDYQEVGNQKFPFDDRKIARAVLESGNT